MRPPFSEEAELRRQAAENVKSGMGRIKSWWRRKYRLPTSHPLFQNQTYGELVLEQLEDLFEEKEDLESALEKDPGAAHAGALRERLEALDKALGVTQSLTQDDLVDFWEKEIAAGREPDQSMTLEDLRRIK